jgi:hypothetical protein
MVAHDVQVRLQPFLSWWFTGLMQMQMWGRTHPMQVNGCYGSGPSWVSDEWWQMATPIGLVGCTYMGATGVVSAAQNGLYVALDRHGRETAWALALDKASETYRVLLEAAQRAWAERYHG